jgi:hypothetical protein
MPLLDKKKLKEKRETKSVSFWWDLTNSLSSPLVFSLQPCNPHPSEIPNFSNPMFFPKTPTPKRKDQRMIGGNSTILFSWPFPSLKWPRTLKK